MEITNVLASLVLLGFSFLCAVIGYANGHKAGKTEGTREGYSRGRAVARQSWKTSTNHE